MLATPTYHTVPLNQYLDSLNEGRLLLPYFQRSLCWDTNDMRLLFDSIYRGMDFTPLMRVSRQTSDSSMGVYWETERKLDFPTCPSLPDDAFPAACWYVIEGQQRSTALAKLFLPNNWRRLSKQHASAWLDLDHLLDYHDCVLARNYEPGSILVRLLPKTSPNCAGVARQNALILSDLIRKPWTAIKDRLRAYYEDEDWEVHALRAGLTEDNYRDSLFESLKSVRVYSVPVADYNSDSTTCGEYQMVFERLNQAGRKMSKEDVYASRLSDSTFDAYQARDAFMKRRVQGTEMDAFLQEKEVVRFVWDAFSMRHRGCPVGKEGFIISDGPDRRDEKGYGTLVLLREQWDEITDALFQVYQTLVEMAGSVVLCASHRTPRALVVPMLALLLKDTTSFDNLSTQKLRTLEQWVVRSWTTFSQHTAVYTRFKELEAWSKSDRDAFYATATEYSRAKDADALNGVAFKRASESFALWHLFQAKHLNDRDKVTWYTRPLTSGPLLAHDDPPFPLSEALMLPVDYPEHCLQQDSWRHLNQPDLAPPGRVRLLYSQFWESMSDQSWWV